MNFCLAMNGKKMPETSVKGLCSLFVPAYKILAVQRLYQEHYLEHCLSLTCYNHNIKYYGIISLVYDSRAAHIFVFRLIRVFHFLGQLGTICYSMMNEW